MSRPRIHTTGFNLNWILFLVIFLILNLNVQRTCAKLQWSSEAVTPSAIDGNGDGDGDGEGENDEISAEHVQQEVARAIQAHKEIGRASAGFSSAAQRYAYNYGYNTAYNYIYNLAFQAGYYTAHTVAYQSGHTVGFNAAHTAAFNQGFDAGYRSRGRK